MAKRAVRRKDKERLFNEGKLPKSEEAMMKQQSKSYRKKKRKKK